MDLIKNCCNHKIKTIKCLLLTNLLLCNYVPIAAAQRTKIGSQRKPIIYVRFYYVFIISYLKL